jgi:hypothetical protein
MNRIFFQLEGCDRPLPVLVHGRPRHHDPDHTVQPVLPGHQSGSTLIVLPGTNDMILKNIFTKNGGKIIVD